ncbi:MAG: LacI family DNA-binding transcriptional regulator, partial [Terriglobia bacterium]
MKLEDVANRAKVSIATVSRVLNEVGPVRNTTKARVLKVVQDLKYHPNIHARTLAGGRSRTLGMIVSNLENPFFLDIFRSLESEARRHAYEVVVANTDYNPRRLVNSVHLMMGRRVAGLAVIVSEMEPTLMQELIESNLPIVFYD